MVVGVWVEWWQGFGWSGGRRLGGVVGGGWLDGMVRREQVVGFKNDLSFLNKEQV